MKTMISPSFLVCACLLLSTCAGEDCGRECAPAIVVERWQRYENDFSELQKRGFSVSADFERVRTEIWALTGIRLDMTSQAAFNASRAKIQRWYVTNQARLFWDARSQRIKVCRLGSSRGGVAIGLKAVDPVWQAHISVIEDLAVGRAFQLEEFADAREFFLTLTEIAVPADHSPVVDLIPVAESKAALPLLKDWYSRNRGQLRWDESAGTIVLADQSK